jgi:hypothetical protein
MEHGDLNRCEKRDEKNSNGVNGPMIMPGFLNSSTYTEPYKGAFKG